jgi:hypothetical protein
MYLSSSLSNHVKKKAYESYLDFVCVAHDNNNTVIGYSKNQRSAFIAKLVREAVLACDREPTNPKKFVADVNTRFADTEIFLKAYKEFEIEQANLAGILKPSKLVDDLLDGANLDYKQKSTLESYAVIALKKARELGYSLSEMLDYVRDSVTGTSAYTAMVGP